MLCTMCCQGTNRKNLWECTCGDEHCRHIDVCPTCKTHRRKAEKELRDERPRKGRS